MKCTSCSQILRPVVAVDIDGTLGDYHGHFKEFAQEYLGRTLPWPWDGAGEFSEFLEIEKRTYRDIKLAYRQGGLKRSMPVYPGAVKFMQDLHKLGVEIWIATTRPYLRLDNIDPDTREWLARHGIPHDGMLYDEYKYQLLVEHVEPDRILCVVEDDAELCDQAVDQGLVALQPMRKHNESEEAQHAPRVAGFTRPTLANMVMKRAKSWKEHHDA